MLTQMRQALCEPIVGPPFTDRSGITPLERKITDAQVRGLIAISECVSFDEAARRIGITEPSLHRSARTLERILRRTLYRRTAQGFTTTPPAAELARRFNVAAREIEYGMDEIAAERGHFVSQIVIGNIPHSDIHFLWVAINDLLAKFPDASVEVLDGHYNDLLKALRSGGVDVVYGVLRRPDWASDVEERFLFSNRRKVPRGVTLSSRFLKGAISSPRSALRPLRLGIYRALLGTSDRLSLFSHREVDEDRTSGFEALPYRSPALQRDDGIAIRRDWKPTRIHLEFMDRLAAFASARR